jgi:glycerophosphoryl diester phosphodiesterase
MAREGAAILAATMKIIAHRGASAEAPENTLGAIALACRRGADGIEIDVRRSADDALMVIHDEDTARVTDHGWSVRAKTRRELQTIDAGTWKGDAWRSEKIPVLDEVLSDLPSGKVLMVEIKDGPGSVSRLEDSLRNRQQNVNPVIVISFHEDTIAAVNRVNPDRQTMLLLGHKAGDSERVMGEAVASARRLGCLGLGLSRGWISQLSTVSKVPRAGLILSVWTVNDPREARVWQSSGAHYLTTDDPAGIRLAL